MNRELLGYYTAQILLRIAIWFIGAIIIIQFVVIPNIESFSMYETLITIITGAGIAYICFGVVYIVCEKKLGIKIPIGIKKPKPKINP